MADKTGMSTRSPSRWLLRWATIAAIVMTVVGATAVSTADAANLTPGTPLTTPFPRLSIWWPKTSTQSPQQLARYDWLCLGDWDRPALASIRAFNPSEILLTSTSASEVNFDPNLPASDSKNAQIRAVPAQWLLTQVGATLSQPVDATATRLSVSAVSAATPGGSIALFVPGDTVVLDGEIALVTGVDAGARALTVRRGVVKAATAHAAGARVAATVKFWPKSVMMDLTAACPRVTVPSSSFGPETWAEYNARTGAALVANDSWDGIVVDRAGSDESWLIGNSTARSIDPNRSNRVPADDYAAFDNAWNLGVFGYELRLRNAIGDGKLIVTNWGAPNFTLLNGNNFEGFPNVDLEGYRWRPMVIGPTREEGSYFDWLAQSRQPNLTTIQTYEDDSAASPTGDGSYDNPATKPGFVPNYQKMRYGLTTALMGDGFFSYEINTNGQGALGLLWFDEYDGAGRGKGWLGQPTGPAYSVTGSAANLVGAAGGFDTSAHLASWIFQTEHATASRTLDTATRKVGAASLRVGVTSTDGDAWAAKVSYPVSITGGREYTMSFWARADTTHTVDAWIQQATAPYDNLDWLGHSEVTPEWREFTLTAPATGSASQAQAVLAFGTSTGTVWIDDVRVQQGSPDVWRRDFAGGTALVNATGSAVTVPLGAPYRKLLGMQAPVFNDGQLVSSVTLAPRDGILLAIPKANDPPARTNMPVYRFYNKKNGSHFYTASEAEKNTVLSTLTGTYAFDGVAYYINTSNPANDDPLFRFYNKKNGSHFYTAAPEERDRVIRDLSAIYLYDGPAYDVCAVSAAPTGSASVYRFFNTRNGSHFYTASEAEKNSVLSTLSGTYSLDGVAFKVAP